MFGALGPANSSVGSFVRWIGCARRPSPKAMSDLSEGGDTFLAVPSRQRQGKGKLRVPREPVSQQSTGETLSPRLRGEPPSPRPAASRSKQARVALHVVRSRAAARKPRRGRRAVASSQTSAPERDTATQKQGGLRRLGSLQRLGSLRRRPPRRRRSGRREAAPPLLGLPRRRRSGRREGTKSTRSHPASSTASREEDAWDDVQPSEALRNARCLASPTCRSGIPASLRFDRLPSCLLPPNLAYFHTSSFDSTK